MDDLAEAGSVPGMLPSDAVVSSPLPGSMTGGEVDEVSGTLACSSGTADGVADEGSPSMASAWFPANSEILCIMQNERFTARHKRQMQEMSLPHDALLRATPPPLLPSHLD